MVSLVQKAYELSFWVYSRKNTKWVKKSYHSCCALSARPIKENPTKTISLLSLCFIQKQSAVQIWPYGGEEMSFQCAACSCRLWYRWCLPVLTLLFSVPLLEKKKDADSAAGIKQCKRSCLPHHWLLQTVRGCECLHIYLGREKTATAPCLSWRRLICQRMGRKWVDHPAVLVLFPLKSSVMLEQ